MLQQKKTSSDFHFANFSMTEREKWVDIREKWWELREKSPKKFHTMRRFLIKDYCHNAKHNKMFKKH